MRLLCLLAVAAGLLFLPASAGAEITLVEGANTASTSRFEWRFGFGSGNVERVDSLRWRNGGGTLGSNLANSGGSPPSCTTGEPREAWGQSYGDTGIPPVLVAAGSTGSWIVRGGRTAELSSSLPAACWSDSVSTPVRTRYTFFDQGAAASKVRVERRFSFDAGSPAYPSTQGLRAYVPRMPSSYSQVIYPNSAGTALVTSATCGGGCIEPNWNGTWLAINHPATNAGMVMMRDPGNTSPAKVVLDTDDDSSSNNSSVTLTKPADGWKAPLTETEYLCFYDATSWPTASRSPTSLPPGCTSAAVPVNTAAPSIPGTPQRGVPLTANPGTWDLNTGSFAYQWARCEGGSCTPIAGATSQAYTPVDADVGRQLRVTVTATASGGETDSATAQSAFTPTPGSGSLSGRVYLNGAVPGSELASAPVQACLTGVNSCRATTTDGSGRYRFGGLQAGQYRVTALPPASLNALPATRTPVSTVADGSETIDQDVILRNPNLPPPQIRFTGSGVRSPGGAAGGGSAGGVPVVHWQQPVIINYDVCDIGAWNVEATITLPGGTVRNLPPLDPVPSPAPGCPGGGFFPIPLPPQFPDHGAADITVKRKPKPPATNPGGEFVFPIYIDPSGLVRSTSGDALPDATVTLLQSDSTSGPFTVVPDGSAAMSPMNRKNPDVTDGGGRFGWDVIAGYYKVRAEKSGCHSPSAADQPFVETGVLTIPPPVTDVDLRLECPPVPVAEIPAILPGPAPALVQGLPPALVRPAKIGPLLVSLSLPRRVGTITVGKAGAFAVASARASCPAASRGPCQVVVGVTGSAPAAKKGSTAAKRKAKAIALGSSTLKLAAGKTTTLRGKLSTKGLRQLKALKRIKATISIKAAVPGGGTTTRSLGATLMPGRG